MYISRSFIVALLSAPFLAFAQDANPFKNPSGGYNAVAGQPLTLNWEPTTQGTVSLVLRSGNSGDLDTVTTIADSIQNSGSYTWQVPSDAVRGSSYTIEIVSDSNPDAVNYTPQFVLESTNLQSSAASSGSMSMSTAPSTMSPSAFPLPSGITIDTSYHPSSGSASATASSSGSMTMSMSMSMTTGSSSATMTDSSATDSSMMTSTMTSSASSSDASSSSDSDLQAGSNTSSTESGNGAARATAMAGMLGVVALGALAL